MKNRKVGSLELFRGGPYTDEQGIADWTGSTLKITMRDQYGALIINAQPAVAATGSTWTYQPLAGHVATAGTFQIEITDVTKGVVYPQSGYEQLIIEPILTSTGTAPVNPTNNSITLAMMQQQTPGSVLLYDASGNAIAYPPVAAGRVLTDNGAGLPPTWQAPAASFTNSGTANGRAMIPIQIDRQALAAAGAVTTAAWAAGAYRRIFIDFKGTLSAANYISMLANADAGANYSNQFYLDTGAAGTPNGVVADVGATQLRIGVLGVGGLGFAFHVEFDPRTDGNTRVIHSWSGAPHASVIASSYGTFNDGSWNNTATNWTYCTFGQFGIGASTMTGELVVTGIPA